MWQSRQTLPRPNLLMWLVTTDKPAWPCEVLQRAGDDWRVRLFGPEKQKPIFFNARVNELLDYAGNMQLAAVSNPADRARLALACAAAHEYARKNGDSAQRALLESPAFGDIVERLKSAEPVFKNQRRSRFDDTPNAPSGALLVQAREQLRETTRLWNTKKSEFGQFESSLNSAQSDLLETRERLAQAELAVLGAKCAASAALQKVESREVECQKVKDEISILDIQRRAALSVLRQLDPREASEHDRKRRDRDEQYKENNGANNPGKRRRTEEDHEREEYDRPITELRRRDGYEGDYRRGGESVYYEEERNEADYSQANESGGQNARNRDARNGNNSRGPPQKPTPKKKPNKPVPKQQPKKPVPKKQPKKPVPKQQPKKPIAKKEPKIANQANKTGGSSQKKKKKKNKGK